MLNRRHIRIKVMQGIYAMHKHESENLDKEEKFLFQSIENMYDLYLLMLSALLEIRLKEEEYLDLASKKHLATKEERNPNRKFVENKLLTLLANSESLENAIEERAITNWKRNDDVILLLLEAIKTSELYQDYMNSTTSSFTDDKNFIADLFSEVIAPNEKLYDYLEDRNLTWLDDLPVVNTALVKLLNKAKENSSDDYFTPQLFKDDEDKEFGIELLRYTVQNLEAYTEEISLKTQNWDKDRIADIDFVLLQMAICEFHEFPSIPTKVSINEYIEIAKEYSTPKSNVFINGVLDKIVKENNENNTLNKIGRGLM